MTNSGGRKGYTIWFASAKFIDIYAVDTVDSMLLSFFKNSFTFRVVSLSCKTCWDGFTIK